MNTEVEKFIAGKPVCFAVPNQFHMVKPCCEICPQRQICGAVIEQLVDAFEKDSLSHGAAIKTDIVDFKHRLDYWDDRHKGPFIDLSISLLNGLIPRAVVFASKEQSDTEAHLSMTSFNAEGVGPPLPTIVKPLDAHADLQKRQLSPSEERAVVLGELNSGVGKKNKDINNNQNKLTGHETRSVTKQSVLTATPAISNTTAENPQATIAKADSPEASPYRFPTPELLTRDVRNNAELVEALERLRLIAFQQISPSGYGSVREEICAIHIEMNLRQAHAPQFRPMEPMVPQPDTIDLKNMGLDRQVIDIHWRAYSTEKPTSEVLKYPTLFNAAPFDFSTAERFASEKLPPYLKAVDLHLSSSMQIEHAIVREVKFRDKWRAISRGDVRGNIVKQAGAPQIEVRLRDAISESRAPHAVRHIKTMIDAWKARQLVGDSPKKIARMIALMTGEKLRDESAVRKTLNSVDQFLGKSTKPIKKSPIVTLKRISDTDSGAGTDTATDTTTDTTLALLA